MSENLPPPNHDYSAGGWSDPWLIDGADSGLPGGCRGSIMSKGGESANRLYFGDNLDWLSKMDAGLVDLVYLDPPFNSQATYNLLYKSPDGQAAQAQYQAFVDSWRWDYPADVALARIMSSGSPAAEIIGALHNYMNKSDMMAYLVMMTARLIELQRILKPTGSLYLHCDTSASHYLKIILDSVFGPRAFQNEIIWKRTAAHNDARNRYGDVTDTILLYAKGDGATFNRQYRAYSPEYIDHNFRFKDKDGRFYSSENLRSPSPRPNLTYEGLEAFWRYIKKMSPMQTSSLVIRSMNKFQTVEAVAMRTQNLKPLIMLLNLECHGVSPSKRQVLERPL